MNVTRMSQLDLTDKTVLIREDLNVPIQQGVIQSDARLQASLPTIKNALTMGAGVVICSHLGRPNEGQFDKNYSLQPVAQYLSDQLGQEVRFEQDYLQNGVSVKAGEVVLLDNVRFNEGEKGNDETLGAAYANLCDIFVMDAFGTSHRAQASTEGVIRAANEQGKPVCAGPLLSAELDALNRALEAPEKPLIAIIGGSKVSTKLDVLTTLAQTCDQIIVGGGIANTFLAAKGYAVGASLFEADLVETAKRIMTQTEVLLPTDVVVVKQAEIDFNDFLGSLQTATAITRPVTEIESDEMVLDIAPSSAQKIAAAILNAKTILWNGPVGVFEVDKFGEGTRILAEAVRDSDGFCIAGGGDTLAAIDKYGVTKGVSYMSTGGGAFLEFVEGKTLPAVQALIDCAVDNNRLGEVT